jgi:uncharacterized protein involved in type VI secretion and phage assembly
MQTLPALTLALNGLPLPETALQALTGVRVQQRLSQPAQCELVFADPPGPLEPAASFLPGAALQVTLHDQPTPLFKGELTAVEHVYGASGERQVHLRGYDLLHRLRKRQPVRAFRQLTLLELAQELLAGLELSMLAVESGPFWQLLIQHRQTDLDFLTGLAEEAGFFLVLRPDSVLPSAVHLLSLAGLGEPVRLAWGENLLEARVEISGEAAIQQVKTAGWDPLSGETFAAQSGPARLGRQVLAGVSAQQVDGAPVRTLSNQAVPGLSQAEGLAQAELDRRAAQAQVLRAVAEGDTRLQPGVPVLVSGLAEALCGRHVLTAVNHSIDSRSGYLAELSTAPPAPRAHPLAGAGCSAALGLVARVDDPLELGRVRVALPAFEDVESDWMQVLSPAAGPGKGLVALPDPGDQVLVLLPQGDPAQGVILGGLWGRPGAPDSGVVGNAVRRFTFLTPGGQRLQLDDAEQKIRLEDSTGSHLELSPQLFSLHAAVDLQLEAPGKTITIRGQAIDFERA